jgi:hypothetical protein
MGQGIPDYTRSDLERVLNRDFPSSVAEAKKILQEFDDARWQLRTHMACLKLANGDLEELRKYVEAACGDPRDVISAAEYGRYSRTTDPAAQEKANAADWQELQEWLARK